MKEDTIILNKSYAFSLRIVKLYFHLVERNREYVLSKQIIGIETSIGANVEEAVEGKSRRDFKSKMNTAYQEARESSYQLRLLRDADLLEKKLAESLIKDAEEWKKILASIVNSSKEEAKF